MGRAPLVGCIVLTALAVSAPAAAQSLDQTEPTTGSAPAAVLRTEPRTGDVRIDGRLDEGAWEAVDPVSGFVQGEPLEGAPAEHDTEVRVLFDDEALYVAARMWDSDPAAIERRLVRRDERGSFDWFAVAIDPNLDRRTGYNFQVSAAGVQADQYLHQDWQEDQAWDAIWQSAVTVDDRGWTAEIRIPLSQIRYQASSDPQTWGINFTRRRTATAEITHFALRSRLREGRVSQFGRLEGVELSSPSRRIEMRPYVLSSYHTGPAQAGDPFFTGSEASARFGTDLRIGLGPAFTLDATVNPDFGQVEADPAVINLSAFETRYQERRPFFVEDAQIFNFGSRGNDVFYSRRIGRSPSGSGPDGSDFEDEPDAATILGAAKLTGRTAGGLSVGFLGAVTQAEQGRAFFADEPAGDVGRFEDYLVEPRAEYGVMSLVQDLNGGASQVGGMVTAMHRELPGDGSFDFLPSTAYSGGLRFEHQWANRGWSLTGFVTGNHVRGDSTALIRIQRASNHYFQRPDATRLRVDSTATSMSGLEWRLQLDRQNTEHWTWSVWAAEVTSGFEINDLGFGQTMERLDGGFRVGYREIQPGSLFRNYNVNFSNFHNFSHEALDDAASWSSWRRSYQMGNFNLDGRAQLLNYWGVDGNVSFGPDRYAFGQTRGGPTMKDPGGVNVRLGVNSDFRKAITYRGNLNVRRGLDDSGSSFSVSGGVTLRPAAGVEVELQPQYSRDTDAAQYVTSFGTLNYEPTFGRRYLFADLERTTVSLETRLNMTFSPALSLQLYAQPLLSSGDYLTYKQLVAPRTFAFDAFEPGTPQGDVCVGGRICEFVEDGERVQHVDFDGDGTLDDSFGDRDFNVRSLLGNAVLRWEYRPGSTIFLVWQRSQDGRVGVGDFDFGRDVDALFSAPAENRFILKVNYWLGL